MGITTDLLMKARQGEYRKQGEPSPEEMFEEALAREGCGEARPAAPGGRRRTLTR
jgi:hypothetical protein